MDFKTMIKYLKEYSAKKYDGASNITVLGLPQDKS